MASKNSEAMKWAVKDALAKSDKYFSKRTMVGGPPSQVVTEADILRKQAEDKKKQQTTKTGSKRGSKGCK